MGEDALEVSPTVSYGRRARMDEPSKALLKKDVFVQGLLLKWQKKVLPSISTFSDALHQARAAQQQEKQLSKMHPPFKPIPRGKTASETKGTNPPPSGGKEPAASANHFKKRTLKCFECDSTTHKWHDNPLKHLGRLVVPQ